MPVALRGLPNLLRGIQTLEQTRIIGQVYDLTRPGTYQLQVTFFDPLNNLLVKSNPLTVSVVQEQSGIPLRPPFLLDIRAAQYLAASGRNSNAGISLAVSNVSDHPIDVDIAYGYSQVDVYDGAGNLAPLTENGKLYRRSLPGAMGPPFVHLLPGQTGSGGAIDLATLYDLSQPGRYTVQVIAFDPETNTTVKSNRNHASRGQIIIAVGPDSRKPLKSVQAPGKSYRKSSV